MNNGALQQAIYNRLANFTDLTFRLGTVGIATRVPQLGKAENDSAFPYVWFNFPDQRAWNTKTSDGSKTLVDVHVFTRTTSDLIRRAVEQPVWDALQHYDLSVSGSNVVNLVWQNTKEKMDPDGKTHHTTLTFRVTMDDI